MIPELRLPRLRRIEERTILGERKKLEGDGLRIRRLLRDGPETGLNDRQWATHPTSSNKFTVWNPARCLQP